MEVIEQQILRHISAECIKHRADQSILFVTGVPLQIRIRCKSGDRIFQHIDPSDDIHEHPGREQHGKPERRVAQDIKHHTADEIRSKIERPVIYDIPGFDSVIGSHCKCDLLRIKITCQRKQTALCHDCPGK